MTRRWRLFKASRSPCNLSLLVWEAGTASADATHLWRRRAESSGGSARMRLSHRRVARRLGRLCRTAAGPSHASLPATLLSLAFR